jgi:transposase-like protein
MRKFTIHDFNRVFPTDDACLDFVTDVIYPDGIRCRKCQRITKHHRLARRRAYSCQQCGTHVYPLAGTIFAKSTTPLKSWFYAMYLIGSTRCGISAKQLERELGVTYKTAWRIFKQLRTLMGEPIENLKGEVEIDETYVGGRPRAGEIKSRQDIRAFTERKAKVLGMVERGGKVAALVVPNQTGAALHPRIREKVLPESVVYTDDHRTFRRLGQDFRTHHRIAHSEKVYVVGNVHTNTIEGFFSLLKNGIRGVYHSVSSKHLQDYINEYAFRYNHRGDGAPMFAAVGGRVNKVRYGQFGQYHPIA